MDAIDKTFAGRNPPAAESSALVPQPDAGRRPTAPTIFLGDYPAVKFQRFADGDPQRPYRQERARYRL
jgi:hypothetical protein